MIVHVGSMCPAGEVQILNNNPSGLLSKMVDSFEKRNNLCF